MKGISMITLLTALNIAGICQPNNPIFTGGNGDGWANNSYRQPANNIYNGGNGDGWANNIYRQPANNIYNGGNGDGWVKHNYLQPVNNIYNGGNGDGWSSAHITIILPVSFLFFTASKKNERAVFITWRTSQEINSSYYEVQRSKDAIVYTNIGRVDAAGTAGVARDYNFTDQEPMKGMNYYRLKQVDLDGNFVYTPVRLVRFEEKSNEFVKYYPNPTAGVLNIQVTVQMKAEAKIINVFNAAGEVVSQTKTGPSNSGIIQVDLSRYTNGIYFIQIKTATTNSVQRIILQRQ